MPGKRAQEVERRGDILNAAFRVALRDRLTGLTSRAVAAEAGVSNGLVFFYFKNREKLVMALLDWVLGQTILSQLPVYEDGAANPSDTMLAVVRSAIERLPKQRERIELFFDYWFMAKTNPPVRRKIRTALARYRNAYLPLAEALVAFDRRRYEGVTAEALASVATGFIEGCALQVVVDPVRFDVNAYCESVRALVLRSA
jgi:AcrR family transcriptional regulator